jgi:hypothetical protein
MSKKYSEKLCPIIMRKPRKNVIEIKRVTVSERLIYNGMEGRDP